MRNQPTTQSRRRYRVEALEPRRLLAGVAIDLNYGVNGLAEHDLGGIDGNPSETMTEAALLPDGKILVAGQMGSYGSGAWFVARYLADGSPDPSFGTAGVSRLKLDLGLVSTSLLPLDDGSLLVGGFKVVSRGAGGIWSERPVVARYDANGQLEPTFGAGGVLDLYGGGEVQDLALLPDGAVLATGRTGQNGWDAISSIWRFSAAGGIDTTFGTAGRVTHDQQTYTQYIEHVDVQPDGGFFARTTLGIVRYGAGGNVLQSLGSQTAADMLVRQPDGRFVTAESGVAPFSNIDVRRFLPNGSPDLGFGTSGMVSVRFFGAETNIIEQLMVQPDGKILVCATSFLGAQWPAVATSDDISLARLMPDGSLDQSFGVGGLLVDPLQNVEPGHASGEYARGLLALPGNGLLAYGSTSKQPSGTTGATGSNVFFRRYVLDPSVNVSTDGPYLPDEGSTFTAIAAAAANPGTTVTSIEWQYAFNGRIFLPEAAGAVAQFTVPQDGPSAPILIGLQVTTSDGLLVMTSTTATAQNVAPGVDPGGPRVAAAGATFRLAPTVSDAVPEVLSGTVDFGDGTQLATFNRGTAARLSFTTFVNHTYAAKGTYTITVTGSDGDGGTTTATTTVQVGDLAVGVFRDDDGNGSQTAGTEPSLPGHTVWVDLDRNGARNAGEPEAVTGAQGEVLFDGLAPGSYAVRIADVPGGYLLSNPIDGYFEMATGATSAARSFALTQRAIVTGRVFTDTNGNGVEDPGEPPAANVSVRARVPWVGTLAGTTGFTDASGNYVIRGLTPGTYEVTPTVPSGSVQTAPAGRAKVVVTVGAAERVAVPNFGIMQAAGATIAGTLFRDLNGNAARDAGDPHVIARLVYVDANDNAVRDPQEFFAVSSATTGAYSLPQLAAGTYVVRQDMPDGWTQSVPSPADTARRVTVVAGQSVARMDFGSNGVATYYVRRDNDTPVTGGLIVVHAGADRSAPSFQNRSIAGGSMGINAGDDGDDVFIIDYADGDPTPTGGFFINGRGGNDTIGIVGSPSSAEALSVTTGSVSVSGKASTPTSIENVLFDGKGGGDSMSVSAGAKVGLLASQHLASLTLNPGASLDIRDHALVLDYPAGGASPLAGIESLIRSGYNGGTWDGGGINSSAAATDPNADTSLGYADNAEMGLTDFAGVTGLTGNEVLVKYTYYGDADLTGVVDTDDFQLFVAGYQDSGLPRTWLYGDFDHNGVIDTDDFQVFLYGYQNQGGTL